ncbi:MAG: hypothetical protein K1Y36_20220 [Blastocatellia bacterium]|nr:hypothetical protein [Blastocatellia bacterium]
MKPFVLEHFRIRQQGLPVRCEICHQSDRFNPTTGCCDRCDRAAQALPIPRRKPQGIALHDLDLEFMLRSRLNAELEPDECVLWLGHPVSPKMQYWGAAFLFGALYVIALWQIFSLAGSFAWILLATAFFGYTFYVLRKSYQAIPILYVLTNQRAIVVTHCHEPVFHSYLPHRVAGYKYVSRDDGSADLIFGTSVVYGSPEPFGFLRVKKPQEVEKLIQENFPV